MSSLLSDIKKRRLELNFKQSDMMARIGFSKQQYNHLERKGNPRLDTLELVAKGLNSEIMLIPKEKVNAVKALLSGSVPDSDNSTNGDENTDGDLWEDLLGDES